MAQNSRSKKRAPLMAAKIFADMRRSWLLGEKRNVVTMDYEEY
jgi:hypothetical protein